MMGRILLGVRFVGHYVAEIFRSGVRVAVDVVLPGSRARPGTVRMPLDARSEMEIAVVANLISLTPGTLSVDVAEGEDALRIHLMFLDEGGEEAMVRSLKETVERPVLELLRGPRRPGHLQP